MKKEGLHLFYDISSGSVACALATCSDKRIPHVLYVSRKKLNSFHNKEECLQSVNRIFESLTNEVIQFGLRYCGKNSYKKEIDSISISLSSPWIEIKNDVIEIKKDKPVHINERFIENTLRKEREVLHASGVFCVEENIIEFRIDGTTIEKPYGRVGQNLEIELYRGCVGRDIVDSLEGILESYFNGADIVFHTFPYIAECYIETLEPTITSYVSVDVTEDYTTLSFISNTIITDVVSIPYGTTSFIEGVAESMDVSFEVALSYVSMYYEGQVDSIMEGRIEKIIQTISSDFRSYFKNKISTLPKHICLFSDQKFQSLSKDMIQGVVDEYPDELLHVISIGKDKIKECCLFNQDERPDIFIGVQACYFNKCSH